ncbi:MAG: GDP-mannose 4,6-dehydratase [Phycisphaerales bacterium]|nr:MAG: GDP-mannose 4,6-dehydratase [Phycisphaerales bacterium]
MVELSRFGSLPRRHQYVCGSQRFPLKRKALITGITGQDGSYLAELLLEKDYEVHGIVRRVAMEAPSHRLCRIEHLLPDLKLHAASLESYPSIFKVVRQVQPHECYHLAAQSYVGYSFEDEFSTLNININGTHYVLSALKEACPQCRFYFAGTSEMYGASVEVPQDESTPFHPRSAYGISKVAGFELTRNYREAYGLHATSGILYNHESPRRGYEFVTRKVTNHIARIVEGLDHEVHLGNLDAKRDWGHAADYVRAMWLMLQQEKPDDYVVATGRTHSVRKFCELAFKVAGLDYEGYVKVDELFFRPAEVHVLQGNAAKAQAKLGWTPQRTFEELVTEMVEWDLEQLRSSHPKGRIGGGTPVAEDDS